MRRPSPWIALVPLSVGAVILGLGVAQAVRGDASEEIEPLWVDPGAIALGAFPDWCDPRWREETLETLAGFGAFRADDAGAFEELGFALEDLSFIQGSDRPYLDAHGELVIGFDLRRPVAAIQAADGFLTVCAEGVALSGRWSAPPRCEDLWLPVILPRLSSEIGSDLAADLDSEESGRFSFELATPGDWLVEPAHLAALDTAVSLGTHLGANERARLGRVAIDGAHHDVRGPADPGVMIGLDDGRWILFGRAPSVDAPGELSAARKWRAVAQAVDQRRRGGPESRWSLADVRWDVPELSFDDEVTAHFAAVVEASRPRAHDPAAAGVSAFPAHWRTDGGGGGGDADGASARTAEWISRPPADAGRAPAGSTRSPGSSGTRPRVR